MKEMINFIKVSVWCLLIPVKIFAQGEPNIQKHSLLAPVAINIDGAANEWGDKFEAYNHATSLHYSIANDDENLYLVFHCTDADALIKIMASGIDFMINPADKSDKNNAVSVLFPYYPDNKPVYINFTHLPKAPSSSKADSLMKMYNTRLNNKVKYIKVSGAAGVDSVISIYNENGIRAKGAFDINMAYTYELAFPLKYLNNLTSFKYHVILRGATTHSMETVATKDAYGRIISARGPSEGVPSKSHAIAEYSTTDFRGEYQLAKGDKK